MRCDGGWRARDLRRLYGGGGVDLGQLFQYDLLGESGRLAALDLFNAILYFHLL